MIASSSSLKTLAIRTPLVNPSSLGSDFHTYRKAWPTSCSSQGLEPQSEFLYKVFDVYDIDGVGSNTTSSARVSASSTKDSRRG